MASPSWKPKFLTLIFREMFAIMPCIDLLHVRDHSTTKRDLGASLYTN